MIIKNKKELSTSIIRKKSLDIIEAGINSVMPKNVMRNQIKVKGSMLTIKNRKFNLNKFRDIYVIGFGKSSSLMAEEIENILKNKITKGIVISTKKARLRRIKLEIGTHPFPSLKNVNATKRIVNLLKKLDRRDLVICLISGGGSALLCYPNVTFNRYIKVINKAFSSGIDINRFNKIRKKYSNVKGGKLAELTEAKIISLIFSDVVGDGLSTIASGPTYGKGLKNVDNIILLNNKVALASMKKKALSLGFKPIILTDKLKGESKLTGKKLIKSIGKYKNKNCLLFGGETTVTVKGNGKGGRNQELCLGAIEEINKFENAVLISIGTDGIDGPTDAAGAIVDNNSFNKSINKKLDYKKYLKNNDSYSFFKKTNDLVFTGVTGSNVADIGVLIITNTTNQQRKH
jgi:hydroxypyruvate reductase/glycerate 2-kinase